MPQKLRISSSLRCDVLVIGAGGAGLRCAAAVLEKKPGIAEMLDWAAALAGLGLNDLAQDRAAVQATLVCLLKTAADRDAAPPEVIDRIVGKVA